MSDVRERLIARFEEALAALLADVDASGEHPTVALDVPRQKEHGDFACNVALQLAKQLRRPPREIATLLVERLLAAGAEDAGLIARAEVAGPGFVNVWLSEDRWRDVLREILESETRYGRSDDGKRRKIQVEFVSANPTGPLSTGHGRQAVLGDCIARILEFTGWDVTREYYFNDGGRQMRVLGESVKARYLEQLGRAAPPPEAALNDPENAWVDSIKGLPVVFPKDGYRGEYLAEIAAALRVEHGDALIGDAAEGPRTSSMSAPHSPSVVPSWTASARIPETYGSWKRS